MRQGNSNRFEEYITLRAELLNHLGFSQQILYWTLALVIAGLAWYLGKPEEERISPFVFAILLYGLIGVSVGVYLVFIGQVYRIGAYLAVFWESRDPERGLVWHRFNRRGAVGGFLPDAAVVVYAGIVATIVAFLVFFTFTPRPRRGSVLNIPFVLFGVGCIIFFVSWFRNRLRSEREDYETAWRSIKTSGIRQKEIHDAYETGTII